MFSVSLAARPQPSGTLIRPPPNPAGESEAFIGNEGEAPDVIRGNLEPVATARVLNEAGWHHGLLSLPFPWLTLRPSESLEQCPQ